MSTSEEKRMSKTQYTSMESRDRLGRRQFLITGAVAGAGLVLGNPAAWAKDRQTGRQPARIKTNIDEALAVPRTNMSIPGPFPGKVVEVFDEHATKDRQVSYEVVRAMFRKGLRHLTGKHSRQSFALFFERDDVIGIKVNPVGAGVISTHLEVVDAIIDWLETNGIPRKQIVIWDRFDYMLTDAGFTPERFPGIGIVGLQTMDEAAAEGKTEDNSRWLNEDGSHVSVPNFDQEVYYWADVEGPKDLPYLNQHVVNGKYSYFGKLITQRLTKIINVPAFKNTGNGISMATKNLGYGAVCNTNRLHRPLFFDVCVEVLAFPAVRDKLVLNITDGLIGQYEGGPAGNAKFTYTLNKLYFATDPFAIDKVCHDSIVQKRKDMSIQVNEHPIYSSYFDYAQEIGLGKTSPEVLEHIRV